MKFADRDQLTGDGFAPPRASKRWYESWDCLFRSGVGVPRPVCRAEGTPPNPVDAQPRSAVTVVLGWRAAVEPFTNLPVMALVMGSAVAVGAPFGDRGLGVTRSGGRFDVATGGRAAVMSLAIVLSFRFVRPGIERIPVCKCVSSARSLSSSESSFVAAPAARWASVPSWRSPTCGRPARCGCLTN